MSVPVYDTIPGEEYYNMKDKNLIESYPMYTAAPKTASNGRTYSSMLNDTNDMIQEPFDLSPPESPVHQSFSHQRLEKRSYTTSYIPTTYEISADKSVSIPSPRATPDNENIIGINRDTFTSSSSTTRPLSSLQDHKPLKRYSSIDMDINDHLATEDIPYSQSSVSLGRHHTTGHTLKSARQRMQDKERIHILQRSEGLQRELTSRRKAFKRLSRLIDKKDNDDDTTISFGTPIGKEHPNYILMYNMLTGIRIAVSRVTAKENRSITDEDFTAAHKLAFNVVGDELTPSAKYDFKFKDYAPWVFRHLRDQFGVDPADYLISLTSQYILSELGSPGKSGSFFYYSKDYRFIIKTIHYTEHKFMLSILKEYYEHIRNNTDTLLCRYYGLHRIKLPKGRKIHFVVMSNVFPPNKDIHETYDLKGSTLGRDLPEEEIRKNPYAVMKDLNWEKRNRKLQLGPIKRKMFIAQLISDVTLLSQLNIMDYSLLIGIHDMNRGNKEGVRDTTLQSFQPDTKSAQRRATMQKRRTSKAQVYRKAIAETNPDKLDVSKLPQETQERRKCKFYSDEGGFRGTDEVDRPLPVLYSLGIIDILTPYDLKKKSEHVYKSITQDKKAISAVRPTQYGKRFLDFMTDAVLEHNEDIKTEYTLHTRKKHLFNY